MHPASTSVAFRDGIGQGKQRWGRFAQLWSGWGIGEKVAVVVVVAVAVVVVVGVVMVGVGCYMVDITVRQLWWDGGVIGDYCW